MTSLRTPPACAATVSSHQAHNVPGMGQKPCYAFLFLLGTQPNYIVQPPLQLGESCDLVLVKDVDGSGTHCLLAKPL